MSITFRPGAIEDSYGSFLILRQALLDLSQRIGAMAITGGDDPEVVTYSAS